MTIDTFPAGLQVRVPERRELEAVTALIVACDIADCGEADTTTDDLLAEWERKDFYLATDARVVVTSAGTSLGTRMSGNVEQKSISPTTHVFIQPTVVKASSSSCTISLRSRQRSRVLSVP